MMYPVGQRLPVGNRNRPHSGANCSHQAPIGSGVCYVGPEVRQKRPARDIAILVRLKDEYRHIKW